MSLVRQNQHLYARFVGHKANARTVLIIPPVIETLLGLLPLCTRSAQYMLKKMRPWIEPTQSYEKNQLGLSQMFLNSLRFTWIMCMLSDAVCIMRARALLEKPPVDFPLKEMLPQQLFWDFDVKP